MPPLSGSFNNRFYKNGMGCPIRSEIWACLAPGHPEIATKYAYEDASVESRKCYEVCRKHGIDGVVVCGGDGSFRGAQKLSQQGINCICIPCTIDNDIGCCEYTIGYDTATNTVVDLVDKLRDTCASHDRCSVVEVMGRSCGFVALHAGLAVGATSILIPEIPYDFQHDHTSVRLGDPPVDCSYLVVKSDQADLIHGILKLIDGGELREYP